MSEVDELFDCFDQDEEEKQTTVPIIVDVDKENVEKTENE